MNNDIEGNIYAGEDDDDSVMILDPAAKRKAVLEAMKSAPRIDTPPPSPAAMESAQAREAREAKEDRVYIKLEENDNIPPTGQFFGINGRHYMLRPGEPASVPRELVNVLNLAIMSVPQVDPSTSQVVGYRDKLRFPYQVLESLPS